MESWYTKLFSMTLVKVKMHLEGLNGWNEIVKPKKLKVIVWQRKLESHLTFFSKPNKTCNYQYCKWWLYIISNQPQQPAVQINLILATHFGDGTDLRRSPQVMVAQLWNNNILLSAASYPLPPKKIPKNSRSNSSWDDGVSDEHGKLVDSSRLWECRW